MDQNLSADYDYEVVTMHNIGEKIAEWRVVRQDDEQDQDAWLDRWSEWGYRAGTNWHSYPLEPNWHESIMRWIGLGFEVGDLIALIPKAMNRPNVEPSGRWRYYCGIVWRTYRNLQAEVEA